jgi:phage-related tail protein
MWNDAKQEMKLLLKGLDEHRISAEELERIVTQAESELGRQAGHFGADSSCLLPKEVPRNGANIVMRLVFH